MAAPEEGTTPPWELAKQLKSEPAREPAADQTPPWEIAKQQKLAATAPKEETPPWELAKQFKSPLSDTKFNKPWDENNSSETHQSRFSSALDEALQPDPNVLNPATQGALDAKANQILGGIGTIGSTLLKPIIMADNAIAGISERVGSAIGDLALRGKSLPEALSTYLSPPAIQKLRESNPSWDNILERHDFGAMMDVMKKFHTEIFPQDLFVSDTINPEVKNSVYNHIMGENADPSSPGYALRRAILDTGVNLATSPSTYATFGGASIASQGAKAAKVGEEAVDLASQIERYKQLNSVAKSGFAPAIERGEKSFASLKLPFMDAPIAEIKGLEAAKAIDSTRASLEAWLGGAARPYQQFSGIEKFDAATFGARPVENALRAQKIQEVASELQAVGPTSEAVNHYASVAAEFGEQKAGVAMRAQGVKLSPEELTQAQEMADVLRKHQSSIVADLAEAGGPDYANATKRVMDDEAKQLFANKFEKETGIAVPKVIIKDPLDGKEYDFTFSDDRGFGRALTSEAVKTRSAMQEGLGDINRAAKGAFGTKSSSELPRNPLSTMAMDSIMNAKYGTKGAFNKNLPQVFLDKYAELSRRVDDLKYIKFVKDEFGTLNPTEVIEAAKLKARITPVPSLDDLTIAKMSPSDFKSMPDKVFDKFVRIGGEQGAAVLLPKNMRYPKQIVDRIEGMFYQPSATKFAQELEFWNNQWRKNKLTSVFRIGPQAVDNSLKAHTLGIRPDTLMRETVDVITQGKNTDEIGRIMNDIPVIADTVNVLADGAKPGSFKVTPSILMNPESRQSMDAWYDALYDGVKAGMKPKDLLTTQGKDTLSGFLKAPYTATKKLVSLANENAISKGVRTFANGADVVTKRAYARQLAESGMSWPEITRKVGETLMDFGATTPQQQALRKFIPFASFQLKNAETMIPLLLTKPSTYNIFNPEDGYLQRIVQNGWTPQESRDFHKMFPQFQGHMLGTFLRGKQSLMENAPVVEKMFAQWNEALLNDREKQQLDKDMLLSWKIPTYWGTAFEVANPKRVNQTFGSPMMAALSLLMFDSDPYTGERIQSAGTDMAAVDKMTKFLQNVNPVDYAKVYNMGINTLMQGKAEAFRKKLEEGPYTREMMLAFKLQTGSDNELDQIKIDRNTIKNMFSMKYLGVGAVNDVDFRYYAQAQAGVRTFGHMAQLLRKAAVSGPAEVQRVKASILRLKDDMSFNAKAYADYVARRKAAGIHADSLSEAEREALSAQPEYSSEDVEQQATDALSQ